MRAKEFLMKLKSYLPQQVLDKASQMSQNRSIKGGWEVWFQVEIAIAFLENNSTYKMEREVVYPNSNKKCDFCLYRDSKAQQDKIYLELKCINSGGNAGDPFKDAQRRFEQDIDKIKNIMETNPNLNIIAFLATYGTNFKDLLESLEKLRTQFNIYIWDTSDKKLITVQDERKKFIEHKQPRFVIFAMAATRSSSSSYALGSLKEPVLLNGMKVIFDEEVPVQPVTLKDTNDSRLVEERSPEPPRSAGNRYQDHPRYTTDRSDPLLRYRRPKKIHL
jgi:hypothetical protein